MSMALAIETEKHFLEEGRPLNDIWCGITCGYWGKEYSQRDIGIATERYRESGSPFAVHDNIGAAGENDCSTEGICGCAPSGTL